MPAKKATKKKSSVKPKKATTKSVSASPAGLTIEPAFASFQDAYVELRRRLDAIESVALYYFMSGKGDEERIQRANQLIALLQGPVEDVQYLNDSEGHCPDGYYDCNGICQPYPCT